MKYFVLIVYFLGSGLLWGQTQENYITYEGQEYTFVEMQQGADGYYYCVGSHFAAIQFRLFVLDEDLEIVHVAEEGIAGPIGLRRSGDSILMATYDNVSHDFTVSSISYESEQIERDTVLSQEFVVFGSDSTYTEDFSFIQLKIINGDFVGLMVCECNLPGSGIINHVYYFRENLDGSLAFGPLESYVPTTPPSSLQALNTFDINVYQDTLFVARTMARISFYDHQFNLVGGDFPREINSQGFILPYGNDFMSFGRAPAHSGNLYETVPIISFFDEDFSLLRVDSFWSPHERWFGIPATSGGLLSNPSQDTFYACASQGYRPLFNRGAINADAQAYVRAYDDSMNHLWELVLGDTLVHVSILKMERMPNGHLMLIGSEARPETSYQFRPLIIEIDPHGTVVSTTNPVPVQSVDVTLSPNPAVDRLTVGWQGDYSEVGLQIINSSGQQVQRFQRISLPTTLEVGHLPAGMYYLSLFRKGRMVASQPFIKGNR